MEETISTTTETTENQTTQEPANDSRSATAPANAVQPENQTTEQTDIEPDKTDVDVTENVEEGEKAQEPKNWEKIAKDNQASFTKISQEKAELAKKVAELENQLKPKTVENGRINPEFEKKYKMQVDNEEFLAFDSLARRLEPETRAEVEKLLLEAKSLYNPNNNASYNAKMNQIKDYFRADIVEAIAVKKQELQGQIKSVFEKELAKDRQQRADKIASEIEQIPELRELVTPESENFSEEIFNVVKTMFDYTGTVDIKATTNAITKIKELGVKEYLAKQKAETEKQNAAVPSGETVLQKKASSLPTAEELRNTPGLYREAVKKYGMEKVDAVIMKG